MIATQYRSELFAPDKLDHDFSATSILGLGTHSKNTDTAFSLVPIASTPSINTAPNGPKSVSKLGSVLVSMSSLEVVSPFASLSLHLFHLSHIPLS
ncbi:hypothetical protein CLAIMM_08332 [Cladophialophora immunda]|nr:hypothetical protein CLAIMM_08332 [Cladophialophora immunda]